jgi:hypothetical protein
MMNSSTVRNWATSHLLTAKDLGVGGVGKTGSIDAYFGNLLPKFNWAKSGLTAVISPIFSQIHQRLRKEPINS